ncbi:MAG TPA: sigma-54 dependent transcriptional regulator [Nannocystaceae bacterium]|nr:sigma-54 dependent transcriptional regulator [Nannocystaceae bacterium]
MARVLVVEDDKSVRRTLERVLESEGHEVESEGDGERAAARIATGGLDIVLLDLGLPSKDGMDVLAGMAGLPQPRPPVIIVTARDDMQSTVTAFARGAYDVLVKPIDLHELVAVVGRALEEHEIRRRLDPAAAPVDAAAPESDGELLVGRTAAMREVWKAIGRVAGSRSTVLVTGESGTGKELVARAIHAGGSDPAAPFVAVNCSSLARAGVEAELFGHEDQPGRIEIAGRGTLLLDEVADLDAQMQAKLLRMLDTRTFERVGDATPRELEARVVAVTQRDLAAEVKLGKFHDDLHARLRVFQIHLPPLRERMDDLPLLVDRLLARIGRELDKPVRACDPAALEMMQRHRWAGNVRELYNLLQRAVVFARSEVVTKDVIATAGLEPGKQSVSPTSQTLAEVERVHIANVLVQTGWRKKRAAELLGISRPTLDRKIRVYGLERGSPA